MPLAALLVITLGRGQHRQKGQGPDSLGPGEGD
jgi:hypothetical protein